MPFFYFFYSCQFSQCSWALCESNPPFSGGKEREHKRGKTIYGKWRECKGKPKERACASRAVVTVREIKMMEVEEVNEGGGCKKVWQHNAEEHSKEAKAGRCLTQLYIYCRVQNDNSPSPQIWSITGRKHISTRQKKKSLHYKHYNLYIFVSTLNELN